MDNIQKTVLITGASSGIGAAAAGFLAARGMHTILTARREEKLRALAEEITTAGGSASFYPADLSDEKQRIALFETVHKNHPAVDALINNAGFGWYGYFHKMTWETAQSLLDVNVNAVAHLTSLFLPGMLARKSGHIINIGSIAGSLPNQGIAIYSASKAFLDFFTTSLYRELRGTGVHASVMRLGPIETEFYVRAREQENGLAMPVERMTLPVENVNRAIWRLIHRPRRVMYTPAYLRFVPFLFRLFVPLIDLAGPVLLKHSDTK